MGAFPPPINNFVFSLFFSNRFVCSLYLSWYFLFFFSIQRLLVPRRGRGRRFVWLMKAFWGKPVDFYCRSRWRSTSPHNVCEFGGVAGASPVSVHPVCSSPSFLFFPRRIFKFHPDSFHPQPYLWLRPRLPSFCSFSPCFLSRRE